MPITVHTENGTDPHAKATDWSVSERGALRILSPDRPIAEYPPGAWFAVTLDDGVPDGEVDGDRDSLVDALSRLVEVWALRPGDYKIAAMRLAFADASALLNRRGVAAP